ncbi:hypothetical protein ACVBIL_11795 [Shewanella sp. 125m-7]
MNQTNFQAREVSPERETVGRFLYRFAWVIEVFAVLMGVAIALMSMVTSFTEVQLYQNGKMGFGDYTNVFIAAVPFLMVAVVEATKIPFVEAFYHTSRVLWKVVFGFSLLFIALITFESAMNGFERNFQSLIFSIDKYKKELVNVEERLPPQIERREKLANLTSELIEREYNERHSKISEQRQSQSLVIQDRIQSLRASIQTEFVTSLRQQVEAKQSELAVVYQERKEESTRLAEQQSFAIQNASTELSTQRRTLQSQLTSEQLILKKMQEEAKVEIDDAFFTSSSVKREWNAKIEKKSKIVEELRNKLNGLNATSQQTTMRNEQQRASSDIRNAFETRISAINSEIKKLNVEISKSVGSREKDIEAIVVKHQKELLDTEEQFQLQQDENKVVRKADYEKLANNSQVISDIDKLILDLENKRVELRNQINVKVGDNQVYRMAQWFWGIESAADVRRKDVMTVASIWFGSLALLIAFTGIILALASLVIRDKTIPERGERSPSAKGIRNSLIKLFMTFRRYITYRRKMTREPVYKTTIKEVIKEVPVEKVVFRDIPVEVIKKEIVHVPLYTDDKTLINITNSNFSDNKKQGVA